MTFFAKWRDPADIMVGACERQSIPLQATAGETLVVIDAFYLPHDLYVGDDGKLKCAGAVVEVEYLDDETLADLMVAAVERAAPDWRNDATQRLKGAQTFAEAHAILAKHGLRITAEDRAKARRDRELARAVVPDGQ